MIKAVLFDLGGTLWEPFGFLGPQDVMQRAASAVARHIRARTGAVIDEAAFSMCMAGQIGGLGQVLRDSASSRFQDNLREEDPFCDLARFRENDLGQVAAFCLRSAGIEVSAAVKDAVEEVLAVELSRSYRLFPGSLEMLERVRDCLPGVVLGIVSNTTIPARVLDVFLRESGLMERFDFRVLSSSVGWRKPHPAIFNAALSLAGAEPAQAVFVGDRVLEDVEGPKRLGMKALLCRYYPPRDDGIPAGGAAGRPLTFAPDGWVFSPAEIPGALLRLNRA